MCPNIFGECLLGPSASQLRHKHQKTDCENRDDNATTTPAPNDHLLPIQNGILMSSIAQNLQGKMVV